MPRIPYADTAKLSDEIRTSLEGKPSNVGRMLAVASEPVYHALTGFILALLNDSSLPLKLREVAILRVGYLSDAAYELYQHEAMGRHVGLTDEQLAAIKAGDPGAACLSEAEADVMVFTDDVVRNVRASDATLAAVRKHLDDAQTMDLIVTIGGYMMVSRVLETSGVEIDGEDAHDWIEAGTAPANVQNTGS